MVRQNDSTQGKQNQPDTSKRPLTELDNAPTRVYPRVPYLAAGGDSIETQIERLNDPRITTIQRQELASWIGRTQGNQYLQRVLDTHPALVQRQPEGGGAGEAEAESDAEGEETEAPQTLEEKLVAAMEGVGTDESAIIAAISFASMPDRQRVLSNPELMGQLQSELSGSELLSVMELLGAPLLDLLPIAMEGAGTDEAAINRLIGAASVDQRREVAGNPPLLARLKGELSGEELLSVAQALTNGLPVEEQVNAAKALFDLSSAPAGKIREAVALLMLSTLEVDRNTAQQILDGNIAAYYIEDLGQPPNVDAVVTGYGRDPNIWTLYYLPGPTNKMVWAQQNFVGFKIHGTTDICGLRTNSLARWKTLLVHETNHALNPDPTTPLETYKSEFRAYWVAEFRNVADLDERARQVKAHVLSAYPPVAAAYNSDEIVKTAIDNHTRPEGNVTNE